MLYRRYTFEPFRLPSSCLRLIRLMRHISRCLWVNRYWCFVYRHSQIKKPAPIRRFVSFTAVTFRLGFRICYQFYWRQIWSDDFSQEGGRKEPGLEPVPVSTASTHLLEQFQYFFNVLVLGNMYWYCVPNTSLNVLGEYLYYSRWEINQNQQKLDRFR